MLCTRVSPQAATRPSAAKKKKKKAWFKDESMGYAEVSSSGLLLPCKSTQRCPWVAAIALGKAVGTVPSGPSISRENWLKISMYMDSWAVVNGFGMSVMGIRKVGLEGARRSSEETYGWIYGSGHKAQESFQARWCLSESFCHRQGIKQAGRWYSSSSWC